jgi:hypothetical protein
MQDGEQRSPLEVTRALGVPSACQAMRELHRRGQLARVTVGVYVLPSAAPAPVAEAPAPEPRPVVYVPPLGDRLAEAAERAWEARQRRLEWLGVGT